MFDPYRYLRPLLFALPPEVAHAATLSGLRLTHRLGLLPVIKSQATAPISLMGLTFANRLGIAAGLDKNAVCVDALGALGFGFIEVGTVTPKPQAGNARPRLFRLIEDRALVNRMGFPNDGMDLIRARLHGRRYTGICGVNIGKNAVTPLNDAASDYVACLAGVYEVADYVAINISSPNTTDLRRLQQGSMLQSLLTTLLDARAKLVRQWGRHVPMLIKLSADLEDDELIAAARISVACGVDGIIATNTTVRREGLTLSSVEEGGLSGAPLLHRAIHAVECIRAETTSSYPIIGVGGIQSVTDAIAMRNAGADLLQVYTGFVYRGPNLIQEVLGDSRVHC